MLSLFDYVMIVTYLVGMVWIGLYYQRQASRNLDEYYLGGRRMPWWLLSFAGMSSWFDITGTMVITSFLFLMGPRGLFVELRGGTGLVLAFMMVFTGKWHRRSGCMTKGEWMVYRFGNGWGGEAARLLTSVGVVLSIVGLMAYLVRGTGLFLAMFIPLPPHICALITIVVCTIYATLSGFYGVVYTDFWQSLLILAGSIILAVLGMLSVHDLGSLNTLAHQVTGQMNWASSVPTWHIDLPAGYENYQSLIFIAMFYFLRNFIGGFDTGYDQKFFGARSERDCGMLCYLWNWLIMFRWPMMIGVAVLGLGLVHRMFPDTALLGEVASLIRNHDPGLTKNIWHDHLAVLAAGGSSVSPDLLAKIQTLLGADWADKLTLISFDGTIDPEQILPAVILYAIPRGLRGFILVVMLAAGMSTFSSFVNGAGAYFVRDIYQRHLRRNANNRELISISYLTTFLIMATGYGLAYMSESINDIWGWLMMSLTVSVSLAGLLRLYWWRLNGEGVAYGTLVGICASITQRFVWPTLAEWMQFLLIMSITVGVSIVASYLAKPTPRDVLLAFYRSTRPFGWWGPVKSALPAEDRRKIDQQNRADLLALPVVILWQHMLYFVLMQVVIHDFSAFWKSLLVFTAAQVAIYFLWYRKLPLPDVELDPAGPGIECEAKNDSDETATALARV